MWILFYLLHLTFGSHFPIMSLWPFYERLNNTYILSTLNSASISEAFTILQSTIYIYLHTWTFTTGHKIYRSQKMPVGNRLGVNSRKTWGQWSYNEIIKWSLFNMMTYGDLDLWLFYPDLTGLFMVPICKDSDDGWFCGILLLLCHIITFTWTLDRMDIT